MSVAEASRSTQTKRKRSTAATSKTPRAKRPNPREQQTDEDSSLSEDDGEGFDDTPLTRADIPKIVKAVINQFPTEGGTNLKAEEGDINPHLGQ